MLSLEERTGYHAPAHLLSKKGHGIRELPAAYVVADPSRTWPIFDDKAVERILDRIRSKRFYEVMREVFMDNVLENLTGCTYDHIRSKVRNVKQSREEMLEMIASCSTYLKIAKENFHSMLEPQKKEYRKVQFIRGQYERRLENLASEGQMSLFN